MSLLEQLAVDNRELGELGLSIATDLAIAGAFGKHPDRPLPKAPIKEYKLLLINIRTLVRNFLGSIERERKLLVRGETANKALMYEIAAIREMVEGETKGGTKVGFYYSHYNDLIKTFPHANLKALKQPTVIQIANEGMETSLSDALLKRLQEEKDFPLIVVDQLLDKQHFDVTLLMTHYPVDLLAKNNFIKLSLLESHTGRVKNHYEWNTRLTNGKTLENIPFNQLTLQVFGDNSVHFSPMDRKYKNAILSVANERKWTTITTYDRITYSIEQIADLEIRNFLLSLM